MTSGSPKVGDLFKEARLYIHLDRGIRYAFCCWNCLKDWQTKATPICQTPTLYGCWQCGKDLVDLKQQVTNGSTVPLPVREWYGKGRQKRKDA